MSRRDQVSGLLIPNEAPEGYVAVLKSDVSRSTTGNICCSCDWRKECARSETDFELKEHRCMSYGVISLKTGSEISRSDGCSVVFKQKSSESAELMKASQKD